MTVKVFLKSKREQAGVLSAGDFHCACLGKSDNKAAVAAGNPTRDPLKGYGDIPTGTYRARVIVANVNKKSFGPHERLDLTPVSGNALQAFKNGRAGLQVHGGDTNTAGGLRATHGCLRLSNEDQAKLIALVKEAGGECDLEVIEL